MFSMFSLPYIQHLSCRFCCSPRICCCCNSLLFAHIMAYLLTYIPYHCLAAAVGFLLALHIPGSFSYVLIPSAFSLCCAHGSFYIRALLYTTAAATARTARCYAQVRADTFPPSCLLCCARLSFTCAFGSRNSMRALRVRTTLFLMLPRTVFTHRTIRTRLPAATARTSPVQDGFHERLPPPRTAAHWLRSVLTPVSYQVLRVGCANRARRTAKRAPILAVTCLLVLLTYSCLPTPTPQLPKHLTFTLLSIWWVHHVHYVPYHLHRLYYHHCLYLPTFPTPPPPPPFLPARSGNRSWCRSVFPHHTAAASCRHCASSTCLPPCRRPTCLVPHYTIYLLCHSYIPTHTHCV